MPDSGRCRYDILGIVKIDSDFRLEALPNHFLTSRGIGEASQEVEITIGDPEKGGTNWVHSWQPLRGLHTKVGLDVDERTSKLVFYDTIFRFFNSLRFPLKQLVGGLIQLALVREGFMLVHGACVKSPEGEGILLVGLSDVGKTTTVTRLVLDDGYGFLSDDIFLTDGKMAYGFPLPLRIENTPDRISVTGGKGRHYKFLPWDVARHLPLYPKIWTRGFLAEPAGLFNPVSSVELDRVWLLRRGVESVRELDRDAAFRQLVLQHHVGTVDYDFGSSRLFQMYAYQNGRIDLAGLMTKEFEILRMIATNCRTTEATKEGPNFEDLVLATDSPSTRKTHSPELSAPANLSRE